MNNEALNAAAKFLGITDKDAVISASIVALVKGGGTIKDAMSINDAMDFLLGAGTYDKLVSDLYDTLRA